MSEETTLSALAKNSSGKIMNNERKLMAHNVYLHHKKTGLTEHQAVTQTAIEFGISTELMWKIVADMGNTWKLEDFVFYGEDGKPVIGHYFNKPNEIPTLNNGLSNNMADPASTPKTVTKNSSGKIVKSGHRIMAHNIYLKLMEKGLSKTQSIHQAATEVGISQGLMWKIVGDVESTGKVKTPSKKRFREDIFSKLSDDEKKAIRYTVHTFFKLKEILTLDKVFKAIEDNNFIPQMCRTTLFKILKRLGFIWEKRGGTSILVERDDIVLERRRYISQIRKFRQEGRVIYYLGETWLNTEHINMKIWKDNSIVIARQPFVDDLYLGSDKGQHIIVIHIGNEDGFVEGGLLYIQDEMNSNVFESWLSNILPSLAENCVIVMDNAPCHSNKSEEVPSTTWNKSNIVSYLQGKNIPNISDELLKVELLKLTKEYIKHHPVPYSVDVMVQKTNREVLRLPLYHCKLNPIDLVWAQVKGLVASKSFKLTDVITLFKESLAQITAEEWSICMDHVIKEEMELYSLDNIIEDMQQQFVVNTESSGEEH